MPQSPVRIRGVIIPVSWNEEGDVIALAVSAEDEIEYRINGGGRGNELFEFIHKMVEVSGSVCDKGGHKTISVADFGITKPRAMGGTPHINGENVRGR